MTSLDFTRGARSYLRAADMLAVAPVSPDATGFEVRFRKPITVAGCWRPAARTTDLAAVAALSVLRPSGPEPWVFVPNPEKGALRTLQDVPEEEFVSAATMVDGHLFCTLVDGVGFWDQLIAFIRCGGASIYPGRRWQFAALALSRWPLPADLPGRSLSLEIARSRGPLVSLRFGLDGTARGSVGLFAIPDEPSDA
jgi:hypothetical protein